jgi:DNA-binding MarR family transcriptional regulator
MMAVASSDLTPQEYQALARFRHLIRGFLSFSAKEARAAGLPPQQHQLLLSIKGLPPDRPPTVSSLAWHLELRHHSTVELINRLTRRGLTRRIPGVRDKRQVLIEITPSGERLLRRLSLLHRGELRRRAPELLSALKAAFSGGRSRKSKAERSGSGQAGSAG